MRLNMYASHRIFLISLIRFEITKEKWMHKNVWIKNNPKYRLFFKCLHNFSVGRWQLVEIRCYSIQILNISSNYALIRTWNPRPDTTTLNKCPFFWFNTSWISNLISLLFSRPNINPGLSGYLSELSRLDDFNWRVLGLGSGPVSRI